MPGLILLYGMGNIKPQIFATMGSPAADVSATIPDDFDDNNLVNRELSFDTIIHYQ